MAVFRKKSRNGLEKQYLFLISALPVWTICSVLPLLSSELKNANEQRIDPLFISRVSQSTQNGLSWLEEGQFLVDHSLPYLKNASATTFTLVSVLLDLGRGNLSSEFRRPFDEYIARTKQFLAYDLPKILFIDTDYFVQFKSFLRNHERLFLVPFSKDELTKSFRHYSTVQKIRNNETWRNQKGWLSQSPQATLESYNPLVMSKVSLLRQAAELNPWHTEEFLFIDAGHLCHDPEMIRQSSVQQSISSTYLQQGFLMTGFAYHPDGEIHGFEEKAFHEYIGTNSTPVMVVRGGIFGGTLEYIKLVDCLFSVILDETLSKGFMGTEENVLSIIYYRWPGVVNFFDNGEQGNCAIFEDFKKKKQMNFRGLICAVETHGDPVCYMADRSQYCSDEVTPHFLTEAKGQLLCQDGANDFFCTVNCSPDGDVKWSAHNKKFCERNPGRCPEQPLPEPVGKQLALHIPTMAPAPSCRVRAGGKWASYPMNFWKGDASSLLNYSSHLSNKAHDGTFFQISVVMLVMNVEREISAALGTLQTYEAHGLLFGVDEFILWINGKDDGATSSFQYFITKYGFKVLGSSSNVGQTWAINSLFEAASHEFVLFLEKDFRLIEPWSCVVEQLSAGIDLLESDKAQMVKYRHRWRPGYPNWASILFRGREETVWDRQPNLFCNHYHWIERPEERWPGQVSRCHNAIDMYCYDARYCSFTLNPVMMRKSFWLREYRDKFPEWKVHDPFVNLEYYMNWEEGAWNDRGWVVAQGAGLFRHEDVEKWA